MSVGGRGASGHVSAFRRAEKCWILTALARPDELGIYVKGALATGVTVDEIKEVLVHATVYCGTPAGRQAFRAAHEALLAAGALPGPG